MFISRDPIGLLGGNNVFQYAPNPIGWVDPFGLTNKPKNSPLFDKWLDKGGTVWSEIDTRTVVYKDWDGNIVRYPNGYPDFKEAGLVKREIDVPHLKGNHGKNPSGDFGKTNNMLIERDGKSIDYSIDTFHHHQNGVTMQEMDKNLHNRFTHNGGVSKIKNSNCI